MKIFGPILLSSLTLLRFILLMLSTIIFMLLSIAENWICSGKIPYKFRSQRLWGKTCLFLLGFVVKKNKMPVLPTYMFMANHRSYIDIFLVAAYSRSAFVAKAELLKWPVLGLAFKSVKAIMVNRDDLRSQLGTLKKIQQSVENGISISIFPEGTTSEGPGTIAFKNGSFKIAAELGIPVIPCAIAYNDRKHAWVGNDTFIPHFFRQMWKPFSTVHIRFDQPLKEAGFSTLKKKCHESINKMLGDIE
ncbi:MAG: 1-acyl-sn-glycerol-3-phosphate acyltransferase [Prolixibacteraceae bacterium]|nr:1-acyl-sn-glycerol-3-phosphate acyltransferase [Prolixibacteraceae bacterium]